MAFLFFSLISYWEISFFISLLMTRCDYAKKISVVVCVGKRIHCYEFRFVWKKPDDG